MFISSLFFFFRAYYCCVSQKTEKKQRRRRFNETMISLLLNEVLLVHFYYLDTNHFKESRITNVNVSSIKINLNNLLQKVHVFGGKYYNARYLTLGPACQELIGNSSFLADHLRDTLTSAISAQCSSKQIYRMYTSWESNNQWNNSDNFLRFFFLFERLGQ